jgi:hypothetical protein
MKLGLYNLALEPVSAAYFINPSHQSACLFVYPLPLLGNDTVETLPLQRIHMQQYKNCRMHRFYTVRIVLTVLPRISFYILDMCTRRRVKKLAFRNIVTVDLRRDEIRCILKLSAILTMSNFIGVCCYRLYVVWTVQSQLPNLYIFIYIHSLKHQTMLHYRHT